MVMRMIEPLSEKQMLEFVRLFPAKNISSLEFQMYNGTATRGKELPGGVEFTNPEFTLSGKTLDAILNALKLVDYNQMQTITIRLKLGDSYKTCSINAVDLEICIGSADLIDFKTLKKFCETTGIEKLTFRF